MNPMSSTYTLQFLERLHVRPDILGHHQKRDGKLDQLGEAGYYLVIRQELCQGKENLDPGMEIRGI